MRPHTDRSRPLGEAPHHIVHQLQANSRRFRNSDESVHLLGQTRRDIVAQQFRSAVEFRRVRWIFLNRKVRNTGGDLQTCGRADRRKRIMRNDPGVMRLGDRRNFFGTRDAAAQTDIRAQILHRVACQQCSEIGTGW